MSNHTNHTKLGIFLVLVAAAVLAVIALFGAVSFSSDTTRYHSYFDESVQGLDLGAPVKFRGVTIGHVAKIDIAPDHQRVDVISELDEDATRRIASPAGAPGAITLPPGLRAQLATQGITGVKFLAVDLFDVSTHPAPELPFRPPEKYIPAAPSTLKNLEVLVTRAMERVPALMDAVVAVVARVDRMLATLERQDVSAEAVTTLRRADAVLRGMQGAVARLDRANLGEKAGATLDELHGAAAKMNQVLDRLDGENGLVATATNASRALGDIGQSGRRTQRDLEGTLRDVSEAADAIRSLSKALERDPEMLLKGKAKGKGFE